MKYRDLDGNWREATGEIGASACVYCGMMCHRAELHPHAACLLFKQTRNGDSVRDNLYAVLDFGFRLGRKKPKRSR